jgi:hypothetical protein
MHESVCTEIPACAYLLFEFSYINIIHKYIKYLPKGNSVITLYKIYTI